ncbi:MAG: hypothetical protein ACRDMZ_21985 [Solirubrobacteraceae bacterium]
MAICGLLVLVGLAAVVRWGGREVDPPEADESTQRPSMELVGRRYLRYVTLAVACGVGAGVLIAGAGGRLTMRLLAATSGEAAQGRTTEAEEIVGQITTGGTVGFILGEALFLGLPSGLIYLLIRRWLPAGRLGGLAYGVLLLVIAGTMLEPLRAGNPDFDIVGPGWLAVSAFGAVVVGHGMLVAALAGRYSTVLPLPSRDRRSLVAHAPLLALVPVAPVAVAFAVAGAVTMGVSRWQPFVTLLRSHGARVAGRVVLVAASLAALPGCVSALVDIAGRGP